MVVLDTSVVIDHLRRSGKEGSSLLMKIAEEIVEGGMGISVVSIQELYAGRSTRNKAEEERLLAIIGVMKVLPYTYEVAKLAGEVIRDLERPLGMADAAIVATAVVNDSELATLNVKDFEGIKGLELYKVATSEV